MIQKCIKWQDGPMLGDRTNLYFVLLTNGKVYRHNKHEGWKESTGHIPINWDDESMAAWKPCSPLEVLVVCGTKGLE